MASLRQTFKIQWQVSRFMETTGESERVAMDYLEAEEYDYINALLSYKHDKDWEARHLSAQSL
jgi:hypothetical protein